MTELAKFEGEVRMLIGGDLVEAASSKRFDDINPAHSEERAISVARRIRAGTVMINGESWYGADAPFGGYKASGLGRQNGVEGFEQYLETKTVGLPKES